VKTILLDIAAPEHLLFYLFAYGLAALPTSFWVAKIRHRSELERDQSHKHTATFFFQRFSMSSALIVLVCDVMKGLLPCAIALSLGASSIVIAVTGLFAVAGHCFSVILRFAGGHGGATFAGALLVIVYPASIVTLLVNYLLFVLKVRPGLASMIATLVGSIMVYFLEPNKDVWLVVIAMVVVVFLRDRISERTNQAV
jgi:glycerol-3-phosphate acyltransferase PlsY